MRSYHLVVTIVFQLVLTQLVGEEYKFVENLKQELSEKKWKTAYHVGPPSIRIVSEWIPPDQTLENFSEMLTIISHIRPSNLDKQKPIQAPSYPESALVFQSFLRLAEYDRYVDIIGAKVKWNDIKITRNDVLYEWGASLRNNRAIHEICRIISEDNEINQIIYTKKVETMDSKSREEWIERLGGER